LGALVKRVVCMSRVERSGTPLKDDQVVSDCIRNGSDEITMGVAVVKQDVTVANEVETPGSMCACLGAIWTPTTSVLLCNCGHGRTS